MDNQEVRERLTDGMFIGKDPEEAMGRLERAYKTIKEAEVVEKKIRKAIKARQLQKKSKTLLEDALSKNVINNSEFELIKRAEALRYDAIQVDDFSEEEYVSGGPVKSKIESHGI